MSFKMKYDIRKDYLKKYTKKRPGNNIDVGFIVSHDTGNPGSTAAGNVNYYKNTVDQSYASAHIFVDDKEIVECIPALVESPERAYHVIYNVTKDNEMYGDDANDIAIGVELCFGGKINNEESYQKYVWVLAYICYKFKLDPSKSVVGHHILDPNRKIDPVNGLKQMGKTYAQLLKDVVSEYNACTAKSEPVVKVVDNSGTTTYTVKSGDTFWGIANQFNLDVEKLRTLNPQVDPRSLQIGQTINLKKVYTVQTGDTLWGISKKFNVTVDAIEKANPTVDPRALQVGDVIELPEVTMVVDPDPVVTKVEPVVRKPIRPYPGNPLKRGDRGRDVEAVQRALGFSGGAVDGAFGYNTERHVKLYQERKGLVADGIVGENTWNVMF